MSDGKVLREKIKTFISAARLEELERLGHDFIEAGASGNTVTDGDNKVYLDCISGRGIYNLGRANQRLKEKMLEAIEVSDQGNFPMVSVHKARLAQQLADFAGSPLECSMFSVTRGEALDFACKLARGSTGRKELIGVDGSFFGETGFALSLSDRNDANLYGPLVPETKMIAFGDIGAAEEAVSDKTAALLIEPVQAENGARPAPAQYLAMLKELCDRKGALLVFDETECGFGRCGAPFVYQEKKVTPHILVVGEALGGGLFPLAATMFSRKERRFLDAHPLVHLSTFGGSDQGCYLAAAVLDEYTKLEPWHNAADKGQALLQALHAVQQDKREIMLSIRGEGLLIGLELANAESARDFCRSLARVGLLALPGRVSGHYVILRPGLLIGQDEVDRIAEAVRLACNEHREERSSDEP